MILGTSAELCEGAILYTNVPDTTITPGGTGLWFNVMNSVEGPFVATYPLHYGNFTMNITDYGGNYVFGNGNVPGYNGQQPFYSYWQTGYNGYINQFSSGDLINRDSTYDNSSRTGYFEKAPNGGYWGIGTEGFAGLMFSYTSPNLSYSNFFYGWARIRFGQEEGEVAVTLLDFAVELEQGIPIRAGQIPEPNGLALLSLGAAGIAYARRRRQATSKG